MKTRMIMLMTAPFLLIACGEKTPTNGAAKVDALTVSLVNNAMEKIGTVTVADDGRGAVRLNVKASTIPPGAHGMHFHEKADCSSADFKSAGGHINPMNMKHGLKNSEGPDNADMENAVADSEGNVDLERINSRVTLSEATDIPALLDVDGSALVIHINPDDQITQPIGGAGARIACAEIRR